MTSFSNILITWRPRSFSDNLFTKRENVMTREFLMNMVYPEHHQVSWSNTCRDSIPGCMDAIKTILQNRLFFSTT